MNIVGIIHFRYTRKRSWNCDRFCETAEELQEWLEHERKVGNPIKQIGPNEYTVKIDY